MTESRYISYTNSDTSVAKSGLHNMEEIIPFSVVNWGMYIKLANKLDPDSSVSGNNWRMLAEKLGYSTQDIMVFEAQNIHQGRNTLKLLYDYSLRQGSTVNELYKALETIERADALGEFTDGLPEIKKSFKEGQQRKHSRGSLTENECHCYLCDRPSMLNSAPKCHSNMNGMPTNISGCMMSHNSYILPPSHSGQNMAHNLTKRQVSVDSACTAHPLRFDQVSPELKRQKSVNDSMAVRSHDGHSQYFSNDMEPMDYSMSVREEAVPPPLGIMRGIQRFDRQAGPSKFMNSFLPSGQDREATFCQPLPPAAHGDRRMHLRLKIPQTNEHKNYRHGHMEIGEDFSSPSPLPITPSTPLDRLTQLTQDKKFQPDEAYADLMRMKHEEELLQSRAYPHTESRPYAELNDGEAFSHHGDYQQMAQNNKCKQNCDKVPVFTSKPKSAGLEKEPPNTFPLRIKSNSHLSSNASSSSGSQMLMKSASVPSNLKPAEFKTAFRDIKVFVTYAADDKRHTQRVLSLCKCLEKNGFTCCVDIYPRKLPPGDRNSWYQKRFDEADFILLIISQKYKNEVDMCEMDNDADDSDSNDSDDGADRVMATHKLHTKQIYRLMYHEYSQAGRCTRFVPVLFQDLPQQLIPDWLYGGYNRVYYLWPEKYKDLLWMLTKPEARIPQAQGKLPDRNNSLEASDSSEFNAESD